MKIVGNQRPRNILPHAKERPGNGRNGRKVRQRKGNWLQVRDFESTLGWVHAPLTSKKAHLIVTAPTANMRTGPGTQHKKIAQLEQHEVVRTLKKSGRWAHVQRESGQKGWIARSLTWGW